MNPKWSAACLLLPVAVLAAFSSASAEGIPPNLIEVTSQNKPSCVEYFAIDGKPYCSTTALLKGDGGVSQTNYDRLNLKFDERTWLPAWQERNPNLLTVEYLVKGDDINSWKELVTSQFVPNTGQLANAQEYVQNFVMRLRNQVPDVQVSYVMNTPNDVVFEFKIMEPVEMVQDEIQRMFSTEEGLYVVHYAIKKPDMGPEARATWTRLLKQATPKQ